jgi:predicted RNA-binding Zn ribbon-like protein
MRSAAGGIERSEPDYRFDFCGGHVAVDFTNTVGSRGDRREDHLNTYGDLLAWAEARQVISKHHAAALKRTAASDPDAARAALARAVTLREAIYAALMQVIEKGKPDGRTLAILNEFVAETFMSAQLTVTGGRVALHTPAGDRLDAMLVPVVRAAVDLLTSDDVRRVGRCADDTCLWLFLDSTRSGTRRWCDMKVCGNRSKVRRFRAT